MKINAWIKYTEGYLPTTRHRKLRYKECESIEDVVIEEITKNQTEIKYKIGDTEIIGYNKRLYSKVNMYSNLFYCGKDERNKDNNTILGRLRHSFIGYSSYFGFDPEDTKEKMIEKAQQDADKYIFIDNELWEVTNKPYYRLTTFGVGNNHAGIGTSLSIDYNRFNHSTKYEASEREEALKDALETAINRGDTDSIEYIKNCPVIEIY